MEGRSESRFEDGFETLLRLRTRFDGKTKMCGCARLLCQVHHREGDGVEHVTRGRCAGLPNGTLGTFGPSSSGRVCRLSAICQCYRASSVHSCSA